MLNMPAEFVFTFLSVRFRIYEFTGADLLIDPVNLALQFFEC
jgi:hypothetical protein